MSHGFSPTIGWLINREYLAYERQENNLLSALEHLDIPFQIVSACQDPVWTLAPVDIVMVLGGIRFVRESLRRNLHAEINLQPLFGTDLHALKDYAWKLPSEYQLNSDMHLKTLFQLQRKQYSHSVFVKPDHALKIRDAKGVHPSQWNAWLEECARKSISPSALFWISDLRDISVEFRVALSRNGIVDYSSYLIKGESCEHNAVMSDSEFLMLNDIAQSICENWLFDDELIMLDVARVSDGLKIIECNAVSSSGWYGLNHLKMILAVHESLISKFKLDL